MAAAEAREILRQYINDREEKLLNVSELRTKLEPLSRQQIKQIITGETDNGGNKVTHHAALRDDTEAMRFFLRLLSPQESYELLRIQSTFGSTALHFSVMSEHIDTMKCILDSIPTRRYELLQIQGSVGNTVLHSAAESDHTKIIKVMLEQLSKEERYKLIKIQAGSSWTAVHLAASYGYTETIKCILKSLPPQRRLQILNITDGNGHTALDVTLNSNNREASELIGQFQASARIRNVHVDEHEQG